MVRLLKLSIGALWLPCLTYAVVSAVVRSTPHIPTFTVDEPDEILTGPAQALSLALASGYVSTAAFN